MILRVGSVLSRGDRLVARTCFSHQGLGDLHIGDVFESLVDVTIRNDNDLIHVRCIKSGEEEQVEVSKLRRELKCQ